MSRLIFWTNVLSGFEHEGIWEACSRIACVVVIVLGAVVFVAGSAGFYDTEGRGDAAERKSPSVSGNVHKIDAERANRGTRVELENGSIFYVQGDKLDRSKSKSMRTLDGDQGGAGSRVGASAD